MDDRVLVEYGAFGLMDLDVAGCPRPWPQEPLGGDAVTAIPNRVDFRSAARDHEAAVCLESTADEPPPLGPEWPEPEEVDVPLSSGRVRLWTVTTGPSEQISPSATRVLTGSGSRAAGGTVTAIQAR